MDRERKIGRQACDIAILNTSEFRREIVTKIAKSQY